MAREQTERLGRRLRERREELDLSQRDVADLMTDFPKVSDQYVSKWERGKNRPDDEHLDALAEALGTTVADLVAGPVAERTSKVGPTPDLMGAMDGQPAADADALRAQLNRIERNQAALYHMLNALLGQSQLHVDLRKLGLEPPSTPPAAADTPSGQAA